MQRLDPARTVLLVIDVQERLIPAMSAENAARVVKNVDLLLDAATRLGAKTIVTEQYPKGLGPTVEPLRGPIEAANAQRFEKICFSAADLPGVARAIDALAPKTVVVVGMETHVCVFQTVRELAARGYDVQVPHDAVSSRRDEDKRVGLDLMAKAGATITATETIVFDWLQRAEGEHFKALSKKMR
jgi:nicotinamidase-related amidase